MNKESVNNAWLEIENCRDKLGEVFFDAIMEDDNSTYEMGKSIIATFDHCTSQKELMAANRMLMAVCGYSFDDLVERIKKRDEQGHVWGSC